MSTVPVLARLTPAGRIRSILSARGSLAWVTEDDAGTAPYYEECGCPMMLASDEVADELLTAGTGRIVLDLHPRLGVVELSGRFWAVTGREAMATLETVRRDHRDCPGCEAWHFTRVIGMQVASAAIRLPGEREPRVVTLDDYELAEPDPMVAIGAAIATHLNSDHEADLVTLAAALSGQAQDQVVGAVVGAVDATGFELSVVDGHGGRIVTVPLDPPVHVASALPEALHRAMAAAVPGGLDRRDW